DLIRTRELAHECGVPVLFSSIGVEPYSETDDRSQKLKEALTLPVVRQITTRDDIESTRKYVEGTDTPTALVADPAVFADSVFGIESRPETAAAKPSSRCIGLVVTRVGCFKDNGIAFSEADQRNFWLDIISQLEARGDDYIIFT